MEGVTLILSQHLAGKTRRAWMEEMIVGERRFVEVMDMDHYVKERKYYHTRAPEIPDRQFSVSLATAVLSTPIGGIAYLLCIERLS